MTNLPIHITPHHLHISSSLRDFVSGKIATVARVAHDAVSADVVLRRRSGVVTYFSASARVALPGRDIHGHATSENLYTAIGKLVARLARLARKRKTRFAKTFKRSARTRPGAQTEGAR
jgi:ribosomal subunit interface protein